MSDYFEFNLNDTVSVKLTDKGKMHLLRMHEGAYPYKAPYENKDGWSEWQAWEIFGKLGGTFGNGFNQCIETTIRVHVKS